MEYMMEVKFMFYRLKKVINVCTLLVVQQLYRAKRQIRFGEGETTSFTNVVYNNVSIFILNDFHLTWCMCSFKLLYLFYEEPIKCFQRQGSPFL